MALNKKRFIAYDARADRVMIRPLLMIKALQ